MNSTTSEKHIVVLAGNPLVGILEDGSLRHEPHLLAFEEAMKFVAQIRDQVSKIYIAFDHAGSFDPFVRDGTSVRKRKKPVLASLLPEIADAYAPIAHANGISIEDISVITESSARMAMLQMEPDLPPSLRHFIGRKSPTMCNKETCRIDEDEDDEKMRISCSAITAEIIRRMTTHGDRLETFWEFDPVRCRPGVIFSGAELAKSMSEALRIMHEVRIHQRLLLRRPDGTLAVGQSHHIIP